MPERPVATYDLNSLLAAQRKAQSAEMPVPLDVRRNRLRRAIDMVGGNAEEICKALGDDFGHRSREMSMIGDIGPSLSSLKHALRHVAAWSRPEKRGVMFPLGLLGARARVEYQPKGVVGVISPWNFPVSLSIAPLAGIFAAGNHAMVKTSEFTPATAALLEQLAAQYFKPNELAFVSGEAEVGAEFAALPFDHLLFTGATGIGRHILRAAAENLTPVTLELGGKSPVILGRSADLPRAAERIALGKMLNAGQICLAPDYLIVPAEREEKVVEALIASASAMYPSLLANPDYTAIMNDRHHKRLVDALQDARSKGAELVAVNPAGEDFPASNARKLPLTIIRNATDDMIVMQEEIFGPLLPVRRYDAIDDAIEEVNRRDRPLGLYYFGSDPAERRRVLDRTVSGGVSLDDVIFHNVIEDLPFGGVGPSGMGSYHGIDGFRTFSHARAVFQQSRFDIAKLAGLKPPYGAATRKAIARQLPGS